MAVMASLFFCGSLVYGEIFTANDVVVETVTFCGRPSMAVAAAFFFKVGAIKEERVDSFNCSVFESCLKPFSHVLEFEIMGVATGFSSLLVVVSKPRFDEAGEEKMAVGGDGADVGCSFLRRALAGYTQWQRGLHYFSSS